MGRKGEKRRWAARGRQRAIGDGEEAFLLISLRRLPGKCPRGIRARCSFMRVGPVTTHCASSPPQLLRKWAPASYCIADPMGGLKALQDVFGAWNTSTPDINVNLAGWSSSQPYPCFVGQFWKGVLCSECLQNPKDPLSNITVVVISLSLSNASIVGTLPPAIGNLTNLLELTLTNNPGLSGIIPKELSNITSLTILNLSNNNFSGSIPEELFMNEDPYLQQLDLSGNQLTGQIPNFRAAYRLNTVKLSQNQLSGPSPPFYDEFAGFGFVNLTRLLTIDLSKNSLIGSPPDFTAIPTLQYVNFSGNGFGNLIFHPSSVNVSSDLQVLDLSQNKLNGSLPDLSSFSSTLQQLDLSFNSFEPMEVPAWLSNLTQLQTLSLKGIGLSGSFPYNLASQLTKLETLELDNNNFNGTLNIDNVANLRRVVSNGDKVFYTGNLQILSIMSNDIMNIEDYSDSDITNITTIFMLQNNPCCSNQQTNAQRCYCNQICIIIPNTGKNDGKVIKITISVAAVIVIGLVAISCWLLFKSMELFQALLIFGELGVRPTIFRYKELKAATNNFEEKLGGGQFGHVYKGRLHEQDVAVKKILKTNTHNLGEFINEVALMTNVPEHQNLVKFFGCCYTLTGKRFLVYEYVENNDLYEALFNGEGEHILNWSERFDIICGVARDPAPRPSMDSVLQRLEECVEMTDWTMDTGVNKNINTGANQSLGEPSNGEITDADAYSSEGVQMLRIRSRS
ncbi:unnamed protein product [Sphagnum tenellum]